MMNMGLGNIGGEYTTPRHKFRWTFEGLDHEGNVVFPQSFVKLNRRPEIEETEINFLSAKTWIPGKEEPSTPSMTAEITQHYLLSDTAADDKKKFTEAASKVSHAYLRLYDGCGQSIEEWEMKDTSMHPAQYQDEDELSYSWVVRSAAVKYTPTICPTITKPSE